MDKWFEDKFERERLRNYAKKRLRGNVFEKFLRKLSISNWLIIMNILTFALTSLLMVIYSEEKVISLSALQPISFFSGKIWTVLTSMFMHAGFLHLFVNMFSLFFIGNFVEKLIGRKRFFWFYMISGILAGLFFVFLSYYLGSICMIKFFSQCIGEKIFSNPSIFAVGASGAIFALAGLLAILTPKNRVYLIAGPLIAITFQAIISAVFPSMTFTSTLNFLINIYIIFSIFAIFSFNSSIRKISIPLEMPFWLLPIVAILPLIIIGLFVSLPIGNMAHLGGLLAGLAYGFYLKNKYKKKAAMISRMYSR